MNDLLKVFLMFAGLGLFAVVMHYLTNFVAPHTAPKLEPIVDKIAGLPGFGWVGAAVFLAATCALTAAMGVGWWMPFAATVGFVGGLGLVGVLIFSVVWVLDFILGLGVRALES